MWPGSVFVLLVLSLWNVGNHILSLYNQHFLCMWLCDRAGPIQCGGTQCSIDKFRLFMPRAEKENDKFLNYDHNFVAYWVFELWELSLVWSALPLGVIKTLLCINHLKVGLTTVKHWKRVKALKSFPQCVLSSGLPPRTQWSCVI